MGKQVDYVFSFYTSTVPFVLSDIVLTNFEFCCTKIYPQTTKNIVVLGNAVGVRLVSLFVLM